MWKIQSGKITELVQYKKKKKSNRKEVEVKEAEPRPTTPSTPLAEVWTNSIEWVRVCVCSCVCGSTCQKDPPPCFLHDIVSLSFFVSSSICVSVPSFYLFLWFWLAVVQETDRKPLSDPTAVVFPSCDLRVALHGGRCLPEVTWPPSLPFFLHTSREKKSHISTELLPDWMPLPWLLPREVGG